MPWPSHSCRNFSTSLKLATVQVLMLSTKSGTPTAPRAQRSRCPRTTVGGKQERSPSRVAVQGQRRKGAWTPSRLLCQPRSVQNLAARKRTKRARMEMTCPLADPPRRQREGNRGPRPSRSPNRVMTPKPTSWGLLPLEARSRGNSSRDNWARRNTGDALPRRSGTGSRTTS